MTNIKLRIALVFDDSLDRPDGVQQHLKVLAAWLVAQGHTVSFICGQTENKQLGGANVFSLAKNFNVKANQNSISLPRPVAKGIIKTIFDQANFDIVHVMLPFSPWFGGRVVDEAIQREIPVVGTFHTYPATIWQRLGSRLYGVVFAEKLKRFSRLISVSESTQISVRQLFGVETIIQPNFIDTSHFRFSRNTDARHKSLVFLGRLVARKGPQLLIEALGLLKSKGRLADVKLRLGGKGPMLSKLRQRVAALDLEKQVDLAGYIAEEDKAEFLVADLSVFPSTGGEAFGISLLEAMATGTLVLGGDNPGYRSVLGSQPKLLVDPTNIAALSERIDELLNDTQLRQRLLKWQASQLKQYDVRTVGPRLVNIYREVLAL